MAHGRRAGPGPAGALPLRANPAFPAWALAAAETGIILAATPPATRSASPPSLPVRGWSSPPQPPVPPPWPFSVAGQQTWVGNCDPPW